VELVLVVGVQEQAWQEQAEQVQGVQEQDGQGEVLAGKLERLLGKLELQAYFELVEPCEEEEQV